MALGQHLDIAAPTKIHGSYSIGPILLGHKCELRFIGGNARACIVAALKGQASRLIARLDSNLVDLRPPAPIRGEIDALTVLLPLRFAINSVTAHDSSNLLGR